MFHFAELDADIVGSFAAFSGASIALHETDISPVAISSRAIDLDRGTRTSLGLFVKKVNRIYFRVNVK